LADWLVNIDFLPAPWERGGKVHTGFKNALQEVWHDLENYISDLQNNGRTIWVTGHSLGAALATLAADRYGNIQGLYTFGSPRVGDRDFEEGFNLNAYRFVNNSDIVTKVPPAGMYRHVGELRFIDSNGILREQWSPGSNWGDQIEEKLKNFIDVNGQSRKQFSEILTDPITDHVPTRYAIHIWNNIPNWII
jgi:predicted lipase